MDVRRLTAPCGLACFSCGVFKDNITEEVAKNTAMNLGMKQEDVACHGCRSESGCSVGCALSEDGNCPTKDCVAEKEIHNCSECSEFPCDKLMPVADGAGSFPHNTKIYNLSRIKTIGLEKWAEEATDIQIKYFKGKFVYGEAPKLED